MAHLFFSKYTRKESALIAGSGVFLSFSVESHVHNPPGRLLHPSGIKIAPQVCSEVEVYGIKDGGNLLFILDQI